MESKTGLLMVHIIALFTTYNSDEQQNGHAMMDEFYRNYYFTFYLNQLGLSQSISQVICKSDHVHDGQRHTGVWWCERCGTLRHTAACCGATRYPIRCEYMQHTENKNEN